MRYFLCVLVGHGWRRVGHAEGTGPAWPRERCWFCRATRSRP